VREVNCETIAERFNFRAKAKILTMVRKSGRKIDRKNNCASVNNIVKPPGRTQPKKYVKVKSFNDLQADVLIVDMGLGNADNVETEKMSLKRPVENNDLIQVDESSDPKIIKLEVKEERPDEAPLENIPDTQKSSTAPTTTQKLSSVQVLGHDLFYKHHGSVVLFKTTSVMDMLSKSLPLMNPTQLESVVDQSGGQSSLVSEDTLNRAYISWKALCVILNGGLLDLAIRDLLRTVRSVGESSIDSQDAQLPVSSNIQDSLVINSTEVKFKVRGGTVYLEVMSAFESLERLQEALEGSWSKVDQELANQGLSQKASFKKKGASSAANTGPAGLTRNYVTLEAYRVLSAGHRTMERVENLVMMVANLKEREKKICNEIQQTVDMILRQSCIVPGDSPGVGQKYNYLRDMEVIDLSSSDAEEINDVKIEAEESSSGIESEDTSPITPRKIFQKVEYDSDGDSEVDGGEFVEIMGAKIVIKTVGSQLFIEKTSVMKLVDSALLEKDTKQLDSLLEQKNINLDKAYLHEGGLKSFISSRALKIFLKSELVNKSDSRFQLLREITDLEKSTALNKECQVLVLSSFDTIRFRMVGGIVHLDSQKLLKLAGFSSSYVYQAPSKANLLLCKILSDRGVNTQNCFSKYGKSKYAFISLPAAHTLLRSEIGPLKDAIRTRKLTEEIFTALSERGIVKSVPGNIEKGMKISDCFPPIRYKVEGGKLFLNRKACFECLGLESAVLSSKKGYNAINNILVLAGMDLSSCYIATKQQRYSYISCLAMVQLLQSRDPLMVCLRNKGQFLSGLLLALQNGVVRVLGAEQGDGVFHLSDSSLSYKYQDGQIFLCRQDAYTLAGIDKQADWNSQDLLGDPTGVLVERGVDPDTAFLADSGDRFRWVSLHSLFVLMSCGPGLDDGVGNCYQAVAWRDILSAVALQEPRLRNHIKMETFKTELLEKVLALYIQSLDKDLEVSPSEGRVDLTDRESGVESDMEYGQNFAGIFSGTVSKIECVDKDLVEVQKACMGKNITEPLPSLTCQEDFHTDQQVPSSAPVSPDSMVSTGASPSTSCLPSPTFSLPDESSWSTNLPQFSSLSSAQYSRLQSDILAAAGGVGGRIGDWEVTTSDMEVTKLSVRPGYGASRKGSFLQPDYAAILRYSLTLAPGSCILTINEHEINSSVLDIILDRGEKEGTLSFLYQLLSLRPCFGSFSPELVETVAKSLDKQDTPELYIDTNFIGTSSSGRTYAGTVRAKDCDFLAGDRVSDCCTYCKKLDKLTINRSILAQETEELLEDNSVKTPNRSGGGKTGQKSVWQLATTSEDGCSFLCPQVQSFNTSLPHAFDGSSQATTIVNHMVEISNSLKVRVELSDRAVSCTFPEFQKDRQLGPLLDWVAGLRLCVGYPNAQLVKQAAFILQNMDRLKPDLKKLFKFLTVDAKFSFSNDIGGGTGSIRSGSCQVTAEPGADICQECRLLQEPVEFLTQPSQFS